MTDKKKLVEVYDERFNTNWDLLARLFFKGTQETAVDLTVDADVNSIIIETGDGKTVTLPTAAATNKDKAFLIQYTNAIQTADLVDAAANVIVDAIDLVQYSSYLCISAGNTTDGNNGYFVICFTGAQALTS